MKTLFATPPIVSVIEVGLDVDSEGEELAETLEGGVYVQV